MLVRLFENPSTGTHPERQLILPNLFITCNRSQGRSLRDQKILPSDVRKNRCEDSLRKGISVLAFGRAFGANIPCGTASEDSNWFWRQVRDNVACLRPDRSFSMAETAHSGPDFSKADLIPVIAQDDATGDVLMLAYMNETAWKETLATGRVCYYSRSRQKLWRKGEESGNVQEVKSIFYDCDADTILIRVNQIGGAACHEGYKSCFFRKIDPQTGQVEVVGSRLFDPKTVYKK
jgi:phosphoribosyl-AMP cyclohydrolase